MVMAMKYLLRVTRLMLSIRLLQVILLMLAFYLNLDEQDLLDRDSLNTINNDQLTQALSFANKVASITVTRKGANPPWHEELS